MPEPAVAWRTTSAETSLQGLSGRAGAPVASSDHLDLSTAVPLRSKPKVPRRLPVADALAGNRLVFDSDRTGNFELFTMTTDGTKATQLTRDTTYDSWSPRLSPDRRTILFTRTPAGTHDLDFTKTSIWVVASDGTGLAQLRAPRTDGWTQQGHPEWSPDQASLVMFGGSRLNPQIYLTDPLGQHPRAITQRGGTNLDPAFSPDGRSIVFIGCLQPVCRETQYEVLRVPATGGTVTALTTDKLRDHDPMYSPDGRTLAWLTSYGGRGAGVWDIRIQDPDGLIRRLVNDNGVTSRPQWSADGKTIYTHRVAPGARTFAIYRITPNGTTLVNLTAGQPGTNEYPSP